MQHTLYLMEANQESTLTALNKIGVSTKAVDFHCVVTYKKVENKYVLSKSKMFYSFLYENSSDKEPYLISNTIDFVVTSIETKNVKLIKPRHSIWKNVVLSKQLGEYNPEFWQNYNVIINADFMLNDEKAN